MRTPFQCAEFHFLIVEAWCAPSPSPTPSPKYFFAQSISESLAKSFPPPLRVSGRHLVLWVAGSFRGRGRSGSSGGGGAPSQLVGGAPSNTVGSSQMSRTGSWKLTPAAKDASGVVPRPPGPLASLRSEHTRRYFRSTGNSQVFLVSSDYFARHNSNPNSMA